MTAPRRVELNEMNGVIALEDILAKRRWCSIDCDAGVVGAVIVKLIRSGFDRDNNDGNYGEECEVNEVLGYYREREGWKRFED